MTPATHSPNGGASAPSAAGAARRARRLLTTAACAVLALLVSAASGRASSITFTGSSGSLAASAEFDLNGSTLTVTLKNTSAATATVPGDVLTGVFFNSSGLTPVSASYGTSTIWYKSGAVNAGDGWGYQTGGGFPVYGMNSAITAIGSGLGNGKSNFSATHSPLDGIDYGILPTGYTGVGANQGITKHGPLFQDEVIFTLTAPSGFKLSDLGNTVQFQYGSQVNDPNEPHFGGHPNVQPTPEPSSVVLLGMGFAGVVGGMLRRRRAASAA
jgi:hypothetical protein